MSIARFAIERPLYSWMLILTCLIGGSIGMDSVGRLEDPPFPIKFSMIVTEYPGASAEEVEQEVTDLIEAAIQELPYVDQITSKSVTGRSEIQVELLEQYGDDETPQIYDELRRRIIDIAARLPPGAATPIVEDDFGDVFGIMLAVSTPDYSPAETHDIAKRMSTALKTVPGVAKIQTVGLPQEAVFVEIERARLARLGLPLDALLGSIGVANQVTPAGSVMVDGRRMRIAIDNAYDSVDAIADLRIGGAGEAIIRLGDIANVVREPVEVPYSIIRHNRETVFALGLSIDPTRNVVEVGEQVDLKLAQVLRQMPLGVHAQPIYAQHTVVAESVNTFLRNLALSVLTVFVALFLFMGWRAGTVVGSVLLLTVMGTLMFMAIFDIPLQRISLGALMIAMGMLVDNGIVIAEGMLIGTRRGLSPTEAAETTVRRTMWPLLGATFIGVLAFAPLSLTDTNNGHFLRSLFQVIAISLTLSWILAVTVVPMLGSRLLRVEAGADQNADVYRGWAYAPYRILMGFGLRRAWVTTLAILLVVGGCLWLFQFVKQGFFPNTNTPLIYVDFRLPEGTDIKRTSSEIAKIEERLTAIDPITDITSFVGHGALRFTTIMRPEQPNSAYAQLVVRLPDISRMNETIDRIRADLESHWPDAAVGVNRATFTPGGSSTFEVRYTGPDPVELRKLADATLAVYLEHDLIERKTDWRQPVLELRPMFSDARAREAGLSRTDLAQAVNFATLGQPVGLFRDGDKLIPIVARAPASERRDVEGFESRLIWSPARQTQVPISQVIDGVELISENATIFRLDRERTIRVQANQPTGHNFTRVFNRVRPELDAIPLPPGYSREYGGEFEASDEANRALGSALPMAFGLMFVVMLLMFGQLKQPIIIWITIPMSVCGVGIGLLATDMSFTFPGFLGLLSVSGMLLKNCIVLVDEMDKRMLESGKSLQVMREAAVSRLRPVVLATATTVAGMSPLLSDVFFAPMAVVIMSGLTFATLITLIAVPVFYRLALGRHIDNL